MEPGTTSLASRRRRATELEIATAAARLMAERGSEDVTVENIASMAGVGLRTFYHYFRNKYETIAPLLQVSAANWREAIAESDLPIVQAIDEAIRDVLTVTSNSDLDKLDEVLALLRVVMSDSDLGSVWLRVNQESERELQTIIADSRSSHTAPVFEDRLLAAAATIAMRVALETWSAGDQDPDDRSVADTASRGFRSLTAFVPQ